MSYFFLIYLLKYPSGKSIILGVVQDEDGYPVEGAWVVVDGIDHNVKTTSRGEYWRLLLNGTYYISAFAPG